MTKLFNQLRNESGMSFIESIVGLAIASAVIVAFVSGLATTSRVVMISEERTLAEDLSKSQLEFIEIQDYIPVNEYDSQDPDNSYQQIELSSELVDQGYSIEINEPETVIGASGTEIYDVQKVTVMIKKNDRELIIVLDNKVSGATS